MNRGPSYEHEPWYSLASTDRCQLPEGRTMVEAMISPAAGITSRWKDAAAGITFDVRPFINGRYQASTSRQSFDHINPANETVLYTTPVGDATDVDAAVRVARRRLNDGSWSGVPPVRRAAVLLKLADLIVQH